MIVRNFLFSVTVCILQPTTLKSSLLYLLQTSQEKWKNICRVELNSQEVDDMTTQMYPASRLISVWSNPNINWFLIFKMNHSMKLTGKNKNKPREFQNFNQYLKQQVNCVQLTGMWYIFDTYCIQMLHIDGAESFRFIYT